MKSPTPSLARLFNSSEASRSPNFRTCPESRQRAGRPAQLSGTTRGLYVELHRSQNRTYYLGTLTFLDRLQRAHAVRCLQGELLQLHKLLLAFPNVSDLDSTASSSPPTSTRQFDSRMTSAQSTSTSVILPFLPSSFSFAERGFCVSAGHPLPAKRTAGRGRTSMKTSSARGFIGIDESGSSS